MHAIILAGGFGTRLSHVVTDVPKPLAPIEGKPFLAWLIDSLAGQGITGATLSVHHEWEKIRDYFMQHPAALPIDFAVEKTPLGTGGAMMSTLSLWERGGASLGEGYTRTSPYKNILNPHPNPLPRGEGMLILNGDTFVKLDYRAMMAAHRGKLSIALRHVPDTLRYGRVKVQNGVITSFMQGLPGEAGLINAGVYVVSPDIFSGRNLPEAFSFERDFMPNYLDEMKPQAFIAEDYFIDIGIPEDYVRARRELPEIIG